MHKFTNREYQILKYIVKGFTNEQIAQKLNISVYTIKQNIRNLMQKTGLYSRILLAVYATENKIIKKPLILIDLDGVLNIYDGKFDEKIIPPMKHGTKEFLEELFVDFELKLFTTRNKSIAKKWVEEYGLFKYFSGITNKKEPCYLIIDDRCIQFNGVYKDVQKEIKNFKVWYKNTSLK